MKVYRYPEDAPNFRNAVITIGTYDGVHLGHQKVISKIRKLASELKGESVLLTFHPHPRHVLHPEDDSLRLIQTLDERITSLERYGIDNVVIATFSQEFAQIEPEKYVREFLLTQLSAKAVVVGYNHRFGHDRKGDVALLEALAPKFDFTVHQISKEEIDHISVSSTRIRNALFEGDVDLANRLMGHPFEITGTVVKGHGMGLQLGYPTANIQVEEKSKIIPGAGIYATMIEHDGERYKGMLYIGNRPTFNGTETSIEVNIFDFDRDVYGQALKLELVSRLRGDEKYESVDELKEQLERDKLAAINTHVPYHFFREHAHDFVVKYRFLSPEEGGRQTGPPYQGYRSDFWYEHETHTVPGIFVIHPEFLGDNGDVVTVRNRQVPPDGSARMWILSEEFRAYHQKRISVGTKGYLMEGGTKVAECYVTEIVGLMTNPTADSDLLL